MTVDELIAKLMEFSDHGYGSEPILLEPKDPMRTGPLELTKAEGAFPGYDHTLAGIVIT